jgi:hypothetical protein
MLAMGEMQVDASPLAKLSAGKSPVKGAADLDAGLTKLVSCLGKVQRRVACGLVRPHHQPFHERIPLLVIKTMQLGMQQVSTLPSSLHQRRKLGILSRRTPSYRVETHTGRSPFDSSSVFACNDIMQDVKQKQRAEG